MSEAGYAKPFLLCLFFTEYYKILLTTVSSDIFVIIGELAHIPSFEPIAIHCPGILGSFWSWRSNIIHLGTHCFFRFVLISDKLI